MFGGLGRFLRKPHVQTGLVLGGLAAIRAYQPSLMDRSRNDQAMIVAGSIASGYLAGNLAGRVIAMVVREGVPLPVLAAGGGAAFSAGLRRQLRSFPDDGRSAPESIEVAVGLAAGAAIAGGAWAAAAAERWVAHRMAQTASTRAGGPRGLWRVGSHAALLGAGVVAGRIGMTKALHALDAAADRIEPGYATPLASPLLSGGPGSSVQFADLSQAGRRMVAEATTADAINEVMGIDSAVDPIRIYVGVDSASTIEARVALAMVEARRTGAFDRSLLMIGSPSGSGYLNYITVEAAEYLTAGDVATITIQYGKRPSLLSIDRIDLAKRQHRALVDAVAEEAARRPPEERPRVVLYGESLGAQTSQDAFPEPGARTLEDRLVGNALWVGTPYPTRFRRIVLAANPRDGRFCTAATIADHDPAARYTFLDHHEDPVTLFTPKIFYRRPPWLGPPATRPPNVSRTQRWVPAVTFFQTAIDTKNATQVVPGQFEAFGHDYRADLAEFVRAAFAISGITDEQMARVERALRRSEIERARRITG